MSAFMLFAGGVIGFVLHHVYTIEEICEECLIKELMLDIKSKIIDRLENKKCDTCKERKEANKILESRIEDILDPIEEGEEHEDKKDSWMDFILTG